MSLTRFLSDLQEKQIEVWVEGDKLRYRAKPGHMTPKLLKHLAELKPDIIAYFNKDQIFPVSSIQKRLWLVDQIQPKCVFCNVYEAHYIKGPLNVKVLQKALNQTVRRHAMLRATFELRAHQPVCVVPPPQDVQLDIVDCKGVTEKRWFSFFKQKSRQLARIPFDLDESCFCPYLFTFNSNNHVFMMIFHHLVIDAWSATRLMKDLFVSYGENLQGEASKLPVLQAEYSDFARDFNEKTQSTETEEALTHLVHKLKPFPRYLELPLDYKRPARQSGVAKSIRYQLPSSTLFEFKKILSKYGCSLYAGMLALVGLLIHRISGQNLFLLGAPSSFRDQRHFEEVIGVFLNTLIFPMDFSGTPSFSEILIKTKDVLLESLSNQNVPFDRLIESMNLSRDVSRPPLLQIMINMHKFPDKKERPIENLDIKEIPVGPVSTQFDLEFFFRTRGEDWELEIIYAKDLFSARKVSKLYSMFYLLLQQVTNNPKCGIHELSMISQQEALRLERWNRTHQPSFEMRSFIELFKYKVDSNPSGIAFFTGSQHSLSYSELDRESDLVSNRLKTLSVLPGDIVAIHLPRNLEAMIALWGVIKAGAVFLLMDSKTPTERIHFMLKDADARLVISDRKAQLAGYQSIFIEDRCNWTKEALRSEGTQIGETSLGEAIPLYLLYTSGSTGQPQGVLGSTRATMNRLSWMWQSWPFEKGEVCSQKTTFGFVDVIWELLGPLLKGVPSLIIDEEAVKIPQEFIVQLRRHKVTRMTLVPSLLDMILTVCEQGTQAPVDLKLWISSGETLSVDLVERFYRLFPDSTLLNLYGSTEVSADVTCFNTRHTTLDTQHYIPIGQPIMNLKTHVLDQYRQPLPLGFAGDLYVSGMGLSHGYHNRPEANLRQFKKLEVEGSSMLTYLTGDRASFLPDGNLVFRGRHDHQIKLRGQRIELVEISLALEQHASIKKAAVKVFSRSNYDQRLIAFYTANDHDHSVQDLQDYLHEKLPPQMLPNFYVQVEKIPLTDSGKINYQMLIEPIDLKPYAGNEKSVMPGTVLEERLVQIWEQVLGVQPIGINDDFFNLGGTSLMAVKLMMEIECALDKKLPLVSLFRASTVAELAKAFHVVIENQCLIPIKTSGKKPPLFLVHGAGGHILLYKDLAGHLDDDQPVYGLQSAGFSRKNELLSVEDMASIYISEIQTFFPEGPYFLGGLSYGGVVAFEMALQLEARGQQARVFLLDALANAAAMHLLSWHMKLFYQLKSYTARAQMHVRNFIWSPWKEKIVHFNNGIRRLKRRQQAQKWGKWIQEQIPENNELPSYLQDVINMNYAAVFAYRPRVMDGKVTLIQPQIRSAGLQLPYNGWNYFAQSGVELHIVPGDHVTLLREPNVKETAETLQSCLDRDTDYLNAKSSEVEANETRAQTYRVS